MGIVAGEETRGSSGQLPYVFDLVIESARVFGQAAARQTLERELRAPSRGSTLEWRDLSWNPEIELLKLRCKASNGTLIELRQRAISELTAALRRMRPDQDWTVRVVRTGLAIPPRQSEHSWAERWGWYAVTLEISSHAIQQDPEAAPYIDEELRKWQRFRSASFAWDQSQATGLFEVQVVARSPANADLEARDALENLVWAAIKEPGAYEVSTARLEWLSEHDKPPRASRRA